MKKQAHIADQAPQERMKFVENKDPDLARVAGLLETCASANQWANFGPLYHRLAADYAAHMGLGPGLTITPCANAGIGLEMLARALAAEADQPTLRWVGSAFSFKNLGRGYFADMQFVDCDAQGVLDTAQLAALPPDSFDGIIVTNPFGLLQDFSPFIRFAEQTGKKLIIDNAAGLGQVVPPWPWQVFSLHHTKPYGMGEGGLVMSPAAVADLLVLMINYDAVPIKPAYWLNNGKISDLSCAFHIARLQQVDQWKAGYLEQRARIAGLFASFGVQSLLPEAGAVPVNTLPVLMSGPIVPERLDVPRIVDITRQYQPLAPLPQAQAVYDQIINFPVHPELARLSDAQINRDITLLLEAVADHKSAD